MRYTYSNLELRRAMRKYRKHKNQGIDTRILTTLFATHYCCSKQRVAGNLNPLVYREKPNKIQTLVPYRKSVLL